MSDPSVPSMQYPAMRIALRSSSHHLSKVFRGIRSRASRARDHDAGRRRADVEQLLGEKVGGTRTGSRSRPSRGRSCTRCCAGRRRGTCPPCCCRTTAGPPRAPGCCVQYSSRISMSSCARPSANMGIRHFPPLSMQLRTAVRKVLLALLPRVVVVGPVRGLDDEHVDAGGWWASWRP